MAAYGRYEAAELPVPEGKVTKDPQKGVWALRGILAFYFFYFFLFIGIEIWRAVRNGEWS